MNLDFVHIVAAKTYRCFVTVLADVWNAVLYGDNFIWIVSRK